MTATRRGIAHLLEGHRHEWEATGNPIYVLSAYQLCRKHGIAFPPWLRDVFNEFIGAAIRAPDIRVDTAFGANPMGRGDHWTRITNRAIDYCIVTAIEEHLENGLHLAEAKRRVARHPLIQELIDRRSAVAKNVVDAAWKSHKLGKK